MVAAPQTARRHTALATVVIALLLAALACGLAALWLAGPAQAAPGSIVWKKTADPTKGPDSLDLSARGPSGTLYAVGSAGAPATRGDIWIPPWSGRPSRRPAWTP